MKSLQTIAGMFRIPTACALCAAAGILSLASPHRAFAGDVRVLRSTSTEMLFEFTPVYQPAETIIVGGKPYLRIRFQNSSGGIRAGAPDLPCRIVTIGVPSLAGNSVSVVSASYETIAGLPSPVPYERDSVDGMGTLEEYRADRALYARQPPPPAAVADAGMMRNERVARIALYPVRYTPGSSQMQAAVRIIVRVQYGSVPMQAGKFGAAFDSHLAGVLLNENVARAWAQPPHARTLAKRIALSGGTEWVKITTAVSGIMQVTAADLGNAGLTVGAIDPSTIQIFGTGGRELPETMDSTDNTPREIACSVFTDAQGKFDHLLFYAKGPSGWNYNASSKTFSHYINNYDTVSSYVLTYGAALGKRIRTDSVAASRYDAPATFRDHLFRDDEIVNAYALTGTVGQGREWFMAPVNPEGTAAYYELLPNLAGGTVSYSVAVAGQSSAPQSFDVYEGNTHLGAIAINTGATSRAYGAYTTAASNVSADGHSNLRFVYHSQGGGIGAVDWYEISFDRDFAATNDALHFWAPDTTAAIEYSLRNFSVQPLVFDVTDDADPVQLPVIGFSGGVATAHAGVQAGSAHELYAAAPAAFIKPAAVQKIALAGLRNTGNGAQFVIITDASLLEAANRLHDYRSAQLSAMVVTTDQIYNEFSEGMHDVTAIRDFLRYAYDQWSVTPYYVLLFGDGSYDYKHDAADLVPPYESPVGDVFDPDGGFAVATDDYYAEISGNDNFVDLAIGRICVHSQQDGDDAVNKIIHYETQSDHGDWRNRVTFVADDDWPGPSGGGFVRDVENLINVNVPSYFAVNKIYEPQYTTVFASSNNTGGRAKPGCYQAIIDAFNNGSLTLAWQGHGNPHVWAHEQVFVNETSIPLLTNYNRLAFVTAATCDFGRFDDPEKQSGSELLVLKPDRGAIGVLSMSRAGYEGPNTDFAAKFYNTLLTGRDQGLPLRVGDALFRTLQASPSGNPVNDSKFYLQGDPTLRLLMPVNPAIVEKVNNVDVTVSDDTIKALMRVTVNGSIRHRDSTLSSGFNGVADVTVFDSKRDVTVVDPNDQFTYQWVEPGGVLFRGQSTVANGRFAATFVVPKDISYENKNGKITVYAAASGGDEAVGGTTNIVVGGTDTSHASDTQGPAIKLYLDSRTFHPGDYVSAQPLLIVDLADSSGINAAGTSLGHGIEAWLDDSSASMDLTPDYRSNVDDPARGTAQQALLNLAPGTHSVRVRAWDVYNNLSESATTFVISAAGTALAIGRIMNIPNPFSRGTTFTLQQTQTAPVNVKIKIYTVAGRLIQTLEDDGVTQHFVAIPWDGLDRDGGALGNGVYLYKVIVTTADGAQSAEEIGRLVVMR